MKSTVDSYFTSIRNFREGEKSWQTFTSLREINTSTEHRAITRYNNAAEEIYKGLHFNEVEYPVHFANLWFVRCMEINLFSSKHLIGQYGFRVIVHQADGSTVEPVKYFMPDKSRGEPDSQPFQLNIFLGCIYAVGDVTRDIVRHSNDSAKRIRLEGFVLRRLIQYSIRQVPNSVSASLYVAPLYVPIDYEGSVKQRNDDWTELLRYTKAKNEYTYVEIPAAQPYDARDPRQSNYLQRILWRDILAAF